VFLTWHLGEDAGVPSLKVRTVRAIRQTPQSLAKARFRAIAPGTRLTKICVLTQPFRAFHLEADFLPGDKRDASNFVGYETMDQFHIPAHVKRLKLGLSYTSSFGGTRGFMTLFGFDPRDVNIWYGVHRSNVISLQF
jgi:hypothetical protein